MAQSSSSLLPSTQRNCILLLATLCLLFTQKVSSQDTTIESIPFTTINSQTQTQLNCNKIQNCQECSYSTDCIWSTDSCISLDTYKEQHGAGALQNLTTHPLGVYWKYQLCQRESNICGSSSNLNSPYGMILLGNQPTLEKNNQQYLSVQKKHICSWNIFYDPQIQQELIYDIELQIDVKALSATAAPELALCMEKIIPTNETKSTPKRFLEQVSMSPQRDQHTCVVHNLNLGFSENVNIKLKAKSIQLSILFQETAQINPSAFLIKYSVSLDGEGYGDSTSFIIFFVGTIVITVLFFFLCIGFWRKLTAVLMRRFGIHIPLLTGTMYVDPQTDNEPPVERLQRLIDEKQITLFKFGDENLVKVDYQQTDCTLCLDNFKQDESLAMFFCKHVFHHQCVEEWNMNEHRKLKCPVCLRQFTPKQTPGGEIPLSPIQTQPLSTQTQATQPLITSREDSSME